MDDGQRRLGYFRRVKRVMARQISEAEAQLIEQPRPDATLVEDRSAPHRPIDPPAAVDPTVYSSWRRRSSHQRLYLLVRTCLAISMALSVAGVACVVFQDTLASQVLAATALGLGTAAAALSSRTNLSRRATGYAIAAIIVAALVLAAGSLVPAAEPEQGPEMELLHGLRGR